MAKRFQKLLAFLLLMAAGLATTDSILTHASLFDIVELSEALELELETEGEKLSSSKSGRKFDLDGHDCNLGFLPSAIELPDVLVKATVTERNITNAHPASRLYILFHALKLHC